jgi:hypothetical protein
MLRDDCSVYRIGKLNAAAIAPPGLLVVVVFERPATNRDWLQGQVYIDGILLRFMVVTAAERKGW